jgi:hypothetical protein
MYQTARYRLNLDSNLYAVTSLDPSILYRSSIEPSPTIGRDHKPLVSERIRQEKHSNKHVQVVSSDGILD